MTRTNAAIVLFSAASWMDDAECKKIENRGVNFFPSPGESLDSARTVCGRCPVKVDCAEYAYAVAKLPGMHGHVDGVWAGTSARERERSK